MRAKDCTWILFSIARLASAKLAIAQVLPGTTASYGAQISPNYGKLPLTFEANHGQTAVQAKFIARGPRYSAFLTAGGMMLSLRPATGVTPLKTAGKTPLKSSRRPPLTTLQFKLVGANPSPELVGEDQQLGWVNYFI